MILEQLHARLSSELKQIQTQLQDSMSKQVEIPLTPFTFVTYPVLDGIEEALNELRNHILFLKEQP